MECWENSRDEALKDFVDVSVSFCCSEKRGKEEHAKEERKKSRKSEKKIKIQGKDEYSSKEVERKRGGRQTRANNMCHYNTRKEQTK